jgi:hypothetical protein
MVFFNWRKGVFISVMIGCLQFLLITLIAMLFYAGGTFNNPLQNGYSFFENFFSDLGRTTNHSGEPNTISWVLFTISTLIIGIVMILFFLAWIDHFKINSVSYRFSIMGSFIGVISGIGFIGVALTPYDVLLESHILAVQIGFVGTFGTIAFYTIALYKNLEYSKRYTIIFFILTIVSLIYLYLLFFGPSSESSTGLIIQVVGQKIIVYSMAICYFIQGYGAWQLERLRS